MGINVNIEWPDSLLAAGLVQSDDEGLAEFSVVINSGGPCKILGYPDTAFGLEGPDPEDRVVAEIHDVGSMSGREHESHVRFFRRVRDSHILSGISETQAGGSYSLRNCFFPFELM